MAQKKIEAADSADLVARARELRSLLAKNAALAERERRLPDENLQALESAGLLKLMVPRRWDGHGASAATMVRVTAELARSCPSTSWVTMLFNGGAWIASLLPVRGQEEIFGNEPNPRVCGVFAPTGSARRVEGGFIVSGRWSFASGCLHASWAGLATPTLIREERIIEQGMMHMPMRELQIEDTWFTAGMRGTGSNTLVAREVFVPDYRVFPMEPAIEGDYPNHETASETSDYLPLIPSLIAIATGTILGMGDGALEAVTAGAHRRGISYTTYQRQIDSPVVHHHIGEAALKLDSAWLHALRAASDVDSTAASRRRMDYLMRARVRGDGGYVCQMVREVLDLLVSIGGASSFAESNPVQRLWRDANVMTRHALFATMTNFELYGRALLGVPGSITPIV